MALITRATVLRLLLSLYLISSSRQFVLEDYKHETIDPRIECRDSFCEKITIRFEAFGAVFALYLSLKKDLFSPNYFEGTQHSVQRSFSKNEEVGSCRYYSGTGNFWAAVSVCDQREVNGVFRNENKDAFHLHFNEKMGENKIYRDDDLPTEPLGRSICTVEGSEEYFLGVSEANRTSSGIESKTQPHNYLELLLVNDNTFYRDAGSNSKSVQRFDLDLVNAMNLAYNQVGINVVVMGIIVWEAKDEIQVSSDSNVTLHNFKVYATSKLYQKYRYDSCHLLSGIKFDANYLGLAFLNTVCDKKAVGINYRKSNTLATQFGNIFIHEVGHNLGLEHDEPTLCNCPTSCFMEGKNSRQQNKEWSSCSKNFLKLSSTQQRFDICLKNLPSVDPPFPVCGNGHIERGEQCDCPANDKLCVNCCDIKSCKLKPGKRCSSEPCCHSCRPATDHRVCRPSVGDCDVPELCAGDVTCLNDKWRAKGLDCDQSSGYCFKDICRSREVQCKSLFGPTSGDAPLRYRTNVRGKVSGHCGHIFKPERSFKPCLTEDVFCGLLWCNIIDENNIDRSRIKATGLDYQIFFTKVSDKYYATVGFDVIESVADPALVWDFTKCGDNKWCSRGKCVSKLSRGCPGNCNPPNGVCDPLTGVCKCKTGFDGSDCSQRKCPNDCNGNGKCEKNGICTCFPGYKPPDCRIKTCPGNCNGHGRCTNGMCVCDQGYLFPDCRTKSCPGNCNPPKGVCDLMTGVCKCRAGFDGSDCSQKMCPNDCHGNGKCEKSGVCTCLPGYQPPTCRDKTCPGNCNDHGTCNNGQCTCIDGFLPPSCSAKGTSETTTSSQRQETSPETAGSGSSLWIFIGVSVWLILLVALIIYGLVYYMTRKNDSVPTAPEDAPESTREEETAL